MKSIFQLMRQLGELLRLVNLSSQQIESNAAMRPRQLQNLTQTYAPLIKRDFREFDALEFLNRAENLLRQLFTILESQNVIEIPGASPQLMVQIKEAVKAIEARGEFWFFDDLTIYKSAISNYQRTTGSYELTVECALSYRFCITQNPTRSAATDEEIPIEQHKYQLKALYIQNLAELDMHSVSAHNCPNCGAPVPPANLSKTCAYCSSTLTEINARIWVFDAYKRV